MGEELFISHLRAERRNFISAAAVRSTNSAAIERHFFRQKEDRKRTRSAEYDCIHVLMCSLLSDEPRHGGRGLGISYRIALIRALLSLLLPSFVCFYLLGRLLPVRVAR